MLNANPQKFANKLRFDACFMINNKVHCVLFEIGAFQIINKK